MTDIAPFTPGVPDVINALRALGFFGSNSSISGPPETEEEIVARERRFLLDLDPSTEGSSTAFDDVIRDIQNSDGTMQEKADAIAGILREYSYSVDDIAQSSGVPANVVRDELANRGYDISGNQAAGSSDTTSTGTTDTRQPMADVIQPGDRLPDGTIARDPFQDADTREAARDARIQAEIEAVLENEQLDEQAKLDGIREVASNNNIDLQTLGGIAGGLIVGAGLGYIFGSDTATTILDNLGIPKDGDYSAAEQDRIAALVDAGTITVDDAADYFEVPREVARAAYEARTDTTPTTTTEGEDGGFLATLKNNWGSILGAAATVVGSVLTSRAASDAADAQIDAANRALDIFQENAGLSRTRLEETTGEAIETIRTGTARTEGTLRDFSDRSLAAIGRGATTARQDILSARDQVRADLTQAYGLEKEAITSAALASSGIISAARERSVTNIMEGFGGARLSIEQARDAANEILQSSTTDAQEKLDLARGNAIAVQERGLQSVRSDFQPYLDAGITNLEGVNELINNPETQRDFLLNNPFFDEFANQAERRLLANQAAQGRVGSGGTQLELRNRLLEFGNQLVDASVQQRLALVQGGLTASQFVGTAEQNVANQISQIESVTGQSLAQLIQTAGVNRAQVQQTAGSQLAQLSVGEAKALTGIETQASRDLAQISTQEGQDIATLTAQNAAQIAQNEANVGTSLAGIATGEAARTANILSTTGTNLANINTAATEARALLQSNLGINEANILTGQAANTAETLIGQGDAEAAGIVGTTNALTGGITNLALLASGVSPLEALKFGDTNTTGATT